jgi:ABC-2 type transport system permease protein
MIRILDIAFKDLLQLSRDFKTFMFLLLMPIVFTFMFGFAFGGFSSGESDSRLPVGYISQDDHWITGSLRDLLDKSEVIKLDENIFRSAADLEQLVADGDLAAAVIVPDGYGRSVLKGKTARLIVITDTGSTAGSTIEAELLSITNRLDGAVRTATIIEETGAQGIPFEYAFEQTLAAWDEPPISIEETTSPALQQEGEGNSALAHTAPGMMLQFAIAGLLTCAQIIVAERKSRTLQRILTTATNRFDIVVGHYLAILLLLLIQFFILILFGQLALKVAYFRVPAATLLVAFSAALCISALGLLIGILAKSEEQAVTFSLIPMFVFSGLGGAWVPLEVTGPTFQAIGHLSPVAWAMDGFENIVARGLGFQSVLLPSVALIGYAILFFTLAVLQFRKIQGAA